MRLSLRRVVPLLSLIFLIATAPALAAPVWTPLGPYGATVWSVVADPIHSGVVYAVAPGLGVFKSVNRGERWERLAAAPPDCVALALDAAHPQVVYASSLWVQKSTDGGARWTLAARGLPAPFVTRALAVDPSDSNRIYLGTLERGLWRSKDGGASWLPASLGFQAGETASVTAIAVPRRPRGTVFAATSRGLYKTLDHGRSWGLVGLPEGRVTGLALAPADPRTVYAALESYGIARSTDGGASWTWMAMPSPRPASVSSLAVDPRSSRTLYAGTDKGLFKSTNAGRSWLPVGPGRSVFVAGVSLDPRAPDTVYAALYTMGFDIGGVLRSFDAGRHWVRRNTGMDGLFLTAAAVDSHDPDWLLAGMNGTGLFLSPGPGRWERSPLGIPRQSPLVNVQSLAASPEIPGAFVATAYSGDLVWKTTDGGVSWTRYSDFRSTWGIVRFDPSRADTFYVLNRQGIFRGTLAEGSLVRVSGPLGCSMGDLVVAPGSSSGPPVLYVAGSDPAAPRCSDRTRSQVFRSTDGGATWTPMGGGLPGRSVIGLAVDPEDPDVLYARIGSDVTGTFHGAWKTEDGGATWKLAGEELRGKYVSALAALPGRVFAAAGEGSASTVFLSEDRGEHWQEHGGGLPSTWVAQFLTTPAAPGRVYAATGRGLWVLED